MSAADDRVNAKIANIREKMGKKNSNPVELMEESCEAHHQYHIDECLLAAGLPMSDEGKDRDFERLFRWIKIMNWRINQGVS